MTHIAIGSIDRGKIECTGDWRIVEVLGLGHDYSALDDEESKGPKAAAGWYSIARYRGLRRTKPDISEPLAVLSFDADGAGDTAALAALAGLRCVVIETSRSSPEHPRHRAHLELATPVPVERYSAVLIAAARAFGFNVDGPGVQQAKDPSRLWYRGVRRVVTEHTGKPFDWRALPLDPVVPLPRAAADGGLTVTEGGRNDFLSREAFRFRKKGASVDAITSVLLAINEAQCEPPLDLAEVRAIAGGKARVARDPTSSEVGFGNAPLPPGATATPNTLPRSRFAPVDAWAYADGPDPQWRVDGLLPEHGLAMIYGASGSGKSFLALDLAMAIERGTPFGHAQRGVKQGRVVYVVAEGAGGFRSRLRAYRQHYHLPAGCPAPRLVTVAPNLMAAADVSDLIGAIGATDVTVFDTLHATTPGAKENDSDAMGILLGHCRSIGAATGGLVVLIHHSGKDPERGPRGSSAIHAAQDAEIEVVRRDTHVFARVTKMRDGPDDGALSFRLVPVAMPFGDRRGSSAVVEHLAAPEKPAKGRKGRTSPDQLLAVQVATKLSGAEYPNGVQRQVLVAAIQSERPDKDRPDNIKRSIERAIDDGLLTIDGEDCIRVPLR